MQNQYLIVAENITFKNNKLSCINILDHFLSIQLPAEFVFDMVVICGPGWNAGEHNLAIKAKSNLADDTQEIGNIKVEIPHDKFTYNALAPDLKLNIGQNVTEITFLIYKNDELVIERTYPVNALFVPAPDQQKPENA